MCERSRPKAYFSGRFCAGENAGLTKPMHTAFPVAQCSIPHIFAHGTLGALLQFSLSFALCLHYVGIFFQKGKKKIKKIKKTQTSHLYDNDAQSWENTPNFFPFFLDALLIVFQLTFFTGHHKHYDKKLYRFTVVWRDNQTWVTKNNIHCSDRSRSKTRLPVEPTYC